MSTSNLDIWVYADWAELKGPKCVGVLTAQQAKGKKAFSFEYDKKWLLRPEKLLLDPDIHWFSGRQYPSGKENFGVIEISKGKSKVKGYRFYTGDELMLEKI